MEEFEKKIGEGYGLDIKSIVPYKNAYMIATAKGRKILRKSVYRPEKIMFVHSVKEYISGNGLPMIDRFLNTVEGLPYIEMNGEYFTACDMIEGRECNFDDREDIVRAARVLASMHKASKGYFTPQGVQGSDYLGKLPAYFQKRLGELRKLSKIARKGKTKFDYLYLKYAEHFCRQGETAIALIPQSGYDGLVDAARKDGIVCHHDFTYSNVICDRDATYLINFDHCCVELKVYDLVNFLRRKMRKCDWDIREAEVIINEYEKIESINQEELFLMKIMLQFPQKFWRVANRYYNSNRSWAERNFAYRLQEVIDEAQQIDRFIHALDRLH